MFQNFRVSKKSMDQWEGGIVSRSTVENCLSHSAKKIVEAPLCVSENIGCG